MQTNTKMKTPIIRVTMPENYFPERCYIVQTLLCDFLGLPSIIEVRPQQETTIEVLGHSGRVVLSDALFKIPRHLWLTPESLPHLPLREWRVSRDLPEVRLCAETLPLLYSSTAPNQPLVRFGKNEVHLGLDVLGSCFFMLSRYEECVAQARDLHNRFPASASVAYQAGFLTRPLVNEYLEVLWGVMQRLWGFLKRRSHSYRVVPTHDVDWPSVGYRVPWRLVVRGALGDILLRHSWVTSARRLRAKLFSCFDIDPANVFEWLMDQSEHHNLQSEFYFITNHTAGIHDGIYTLEDPPIQKLLYIIHERGHLIGLHPSYHTYRTPERIHQEFALLRETASKLGISQPHWGGRQHYLRWENPITWQAYDDAGLDYDSTLGYADRVGFRCGTCYEYPVFNLLSRQALKLRERPLIVMEKTLFDYMKVSPDEALELISLLARRCRLFGGSFVFLWHNSQLLTQYDRDFYNRVLRILTEHMV